MKPVRTRFAPSPTGYLHVGGVRTALFSYLFAKKTKGQFVLRLEDTDRERFVAGGVEQIVESLDWLDLKPDEGFWISEGKHQGIEYIQSERQKQGRYQQYADQLVQDSLAYYSLASNETLAQFRDDAKKRKEAFRYQYKMDPGDTEEKPKSSDYVIRFYCKKFFKDSGIPKKYNEHFEYPFPDTQNYPQDYAIKWKAEYGTVATRWNSAVIDDFIIMKADGFPTYNFANVVDDHLMKITHVLRGNEFIASTAKHIMIYAALGVPQQDIPTFVHLPVINGADGKKLSKRTGDTNALDYRDKGYLPEALINFLALLGWNDGTEQEIYTVDELAAKFDLGDINGSPALFDQKRLEWMNGYWVRQLPLDDLLERVQAFWPDEAGQANDDYKKQVLSLVQERLKYFAELPELTRFFFVDLPLNPKLITEHKQLKKLSKDELRSLLTQAGTTLEDSDFSVDDLTERLNQLLEQTGQKPAVLFSLIRIATTQAAASPGLAGSLSVLGKQRCLARLDAQLAALASS
jgi:nondiscriminating glutamyl-tRNA synthetase